MGKDKDDIKDIEIKGSPSFVKAGVALSTSTEPAPQVIRKPLVKASLHLEQQKFGKKTIPTQGTLFDMLEQTKTKDEAKNLKIEIIGINNTQAQNQALHAIQTLLTQTDYRGNLQGKKITGNNMWHFAGLLPTLSFPPAQYLEAFGVKKYKTSRGKKEFSGEESKRALDALLDLAITQHLIVYKKTYYEEVKGKREKKIDRVEVIAPLIRILYGWKGLTQDENEQLDKGGNTLQTDNKAVIIIEPSPLLVDQIDTYFVLKPANCYQEIRVLVGKTSKYVPLFTDFLRTEVTKREIASRGTGNKNLVIERNYQTLAQNLRMDSYIKTRNWKTIRSTLNKCYEIAKNLGYLKSYATKAGKIMEIDYLVLNPDKFEGVKQPDISQ